MDELVDVVRALNDANDQLANASAAGDTPRTAELLDEIAALERRRNRIVRRRAGSAPHQDAIDTYQSSVPFRDQVIRALMLTNRPTTGRLITDLTLARWGEQIEPTKLSSLRRDELRSWEAAHDINRRTATRDVYVVPALSYDRYVPIRGTLALSTWETSRRLVAPLSPRVDLLGTTITLAEEAQRIVGTNFAEPLARLVTRLGASLPGIKPFEATLEDIIASATAELDQLVDVDIDERDQAAERTAVMDTRSALFGAPLRRVGDRQIGSA